MQVKTASGGTDAKPQTVLTDDALMVPPSTTKTVRAFVNHSLEWNTTSTKMAMEKFTETASLLISHSVLTKIDKRVAVRLTNTTGSPYLIGKNTQIAEFSNDNL